MKSLQNKEVLGMLNLIESKDLESQMVGLTIIEQNDLPIHVLALAYKYGNANEEYWKTHAPKCLTKLHKHNGTNIRYSHNDIINILTTHKAKAYLIDYFVGKYAEFLTKRFDPSNKKALKIIFKIEKL